MPELKIRVFFFKVFQTNFKAPKMDENDWVFSFFDIFTFLVNF